MSASIEATRDRGGRETEVTESPLLDTTMAPTSTSDGYPPLTTLFTPDPSCLSFYMTRCSSRGRFGGDGGCAAMAFPPAGCLDGNNDTATRSSLSCYPRSSGGYGLLTYSPGYFCPVGMTTVDSISVSSGAWCCLSGLTWSSSICLKTTSQATFISTDFNDCTYEELRTVNGQAFLNVITMSADPIRLDGQRFPTTTPFTSESSISNTKTIIYTTGSAGSSITQTKDVPSNQRSLSQTAEVGIILSSVLGTASLLLLAFFCIRRRRKATEAKSVLFKQAVKEEPDKYIGKPELEGSKAYVYTTKPELDATAIRAELEGDNGEPHGDGVYILKPELEGTVGTERNRGAYVRKKPELEAASKPCAVTTQHNIAELEAVSLSTGGGLV
ncbi:hypothetical protein F4860DRAFT_494930 [Xylaria cubensis]|nr:hypothetical protein F4860DRAFT_494930 [Xylaria cubensis]